MIRNMSINNRGVPIEENGDLEVGGVGSHGEPYPGKKTPLLHHFIVQMIILPTQARDKHREKLRKELRTAFSCRKGPVAVGCRAAEREQHYDTRQLGRRRGRQRLHQERYQQRTCSDKIKN